MPNLLRPYRSLWMWLRGRTDRPDGPVFPSAKGALGMPAAFAVATMIEIGVVHFLVPWPWLNLTLAVLSVWSLMLLFGMVATDVVHPHHLAGDTVVLRRSGRVVAAIPLADLAAVTARARYDKTSPEVDGNTLHLPTQDGANVALSLRNPAETRLSGRTPTAQVTTVSLRVDDPERMVRLLREAAKPLTDA